MIHDPAFRPDVSDDEERQRWVDAQQRVEEFLLGGRRQYTRGDVSRRSGVALEHTGRLWSALGFPRAPDDAVAYTEADLEALALTDRLLADDALDEAEELAVARTLGQSVSRLVEWQANLLRRSVIDAGHAEDPDAVLAAVETIVPILERLQSYVWRRHLAATAGRMLAALPPSPAENDGSSPADASQDVLVVGFADIVGFTTLSRQLTDTELRSLLEHFETVTGDVVAQHGARVVKMLGDEVLFTCPGVDEALAIAFDLHRRVGADDDRLTLRIGLARGEVLHRYGDVYGPVVNIASRLTSHARPGTVLVDQDLTETLRGQDADGRYEVRTVPQLSVRGYRHLRPHVVRQSRRPS